MRKLDNGALDRIADDVDKPRSAQELGDELDASRQGATYWAVTSAFASASAGRAEDLFIPRAVK